MEQAFENGAHKVKKWPLAIKIAALCVAAAALAVAVDNARISVSRYGVTLENASAKVRIVLVSDLHGRSFGKGNSRLIEKIRLQQPDAVFLAGDMIDGDADENDVLSLLSLIEALCEVAPVYFSLGNHELEYMQKDALLLDKVASAGATAVNDSYVDVSIAGQAVRIGGTMGHGFYFGRTEEKFTSSAEYVFLKEFEDTPLPKICLAHMPDTFIFNGAYKLWDVDLILSGHTHGGLIRVPFVGGLYAPMQGFFPEYDCGHFRLGENMQMVISSGLAGYGIIPRINNPPEIAVIDIAPKNDQEG